MVDTVGDESNITIVGAGGIGGLVAHGLSGAGIPVAVIERNADHLEKMRSSGLVCTLAGTSSIAQPSVLLPPGELGAIAPLKTVLLAVKAQDLAAALDFVSPYLREDALVIPLQNGWGAEAVAATIGADRTLAAMVDLVGVYRGPGEVERYSTGSMYVGEVDGTNSDRCKRVASLLSLVAPTFAAENIWGYVWSKQIYALTFPVDVLMDQPAVETYRHASVKRILLALVLEGVSAAAACEIHLERYEKFDPTVFMGADGEIRDSMLSQLPAGSTKGNSGFSYDIKVRQRRSEIDYVCGAIMERGQQHGLAMAVTSCLLDLVHRIEEKVSAPGWDLVQILASRAEDYLAGWTGGRGELAAR